MDTMEAGQSVRERSAAEAELTKTGRKTLCTVGNLERLFGLIATEGLTDTAAARRLGIHRITLYRWKERNANLAERLFRAREEFREQHLSNVRLAQARNGQPNWRASAWLLEHVFPEDYRRSRKSGIEKELPEPANPYASLEEIVAELRQDDECHQADLDARVRSLKALDAKVKSLLPAHHPLASPSIAPAPAAPPAVPPTAAPTPVPTPAPLTPPPAPTPPPPPTASQPAMAAPSPSPAAPTQPLAAAALAPAAANAPASPTQPIPPPTDSGGLTRVIPFAAEAATPEPPPKNPKPTAPVSPATKAPVPPNPLHRPVIAYNVGLPLSAAQLRDFFAD